MNCPPVVATHLLPQAQSTAGPSNHLPFQQSRTFLMRTNLWQQRISLVTERSMHWMTYFLIGLHRISGYIYHGTDATSSTPVHATFRDGTVTLMSAVATPKEEEAMVSMLRDIYGVVSVEDELVVRNPQRAFNEAAQMQPASSCMKQ